MVNLIFRIVIFAILLTACSPASPTPTLTRVPLSPTSLPEPLWMDERSGRGIFQCLTEDDLVRLCHLEEGTETYLTPAINSNIVQSGNWLVFSVMGADALGALHRMKTDGTGLEMINPERYAAFEIQRIEDGWVVVRAWNGGMEHDPRSFPRFRVPLEGGEAEELPLVED